MCDVECIDCLSFKSASMNLSLMGETRAGSCFFLALKAGYVQFVLNGEYSGQPGEIKDIIHNVFTEYLLVGKLKCLFLTDFKTFHSLIVFCFSCI